MVPVQPALTVERLTTGESPEAGPEPVEPPDLRLVVPAAAGWLVLLVGLPFPAWLGRIGLGCLLAVLLGWPVLARVRRPTGRHGRTRGSRRRPTGPSTVLLMLLLVVALHAWCGWARYAVATAGPLRELAAERAAVTVEGALASDPRVLAQAAERPRASVLVTVQVQRVVGRGRSAEVSTPVLIRAGANLPEWSRLRWRERVRVTGRLAPADPGDDLVALLTARGPPVSLEAAPPVMRGAEHLRDGLRRAVAGLPADAAGLVPALVIGDRSLTPEDLTDDMRATGMTHLSAVSGTNVTIVLTLALRLAGWLRVPRRARPVLAGLVLIGFVILARPDPSVIRAAVMGAVGVLGTAAARRGAGLPALGAAVIVLLAVDPWLARSYGFALSTLATFGLLVFVRPWAAWLRARLPARLAWLAEPIVIPVAAQVVTAPVIVLLQGSISAVGVLANLLAAPLVAPATIGGVGLALLGPALAVPGVDMLVGLLAWLPGTPALGIAWVAHRCATVPLGTWPWPDGVPGALLLAAITMVLLSAGPWLIRRLRRHPLVAVSVVLLVVAWCWPVASRAWPPAGWRLVACDVGQGDALVVSTGPGSAVLVDAGPEPDLVDACLTRLGVRVLEAVVLTHPHDDHVDGLAGAVAGRRVDALLVSPVGDPDAPGGVAELAAREVGLPASPLYAGDVLRWGEVTANVRWPARRIDAGSVPNNGSLVLDVAAPGLRALLLGDVEREAAAAVRTALRRAGDAGQPNRPVDVVKVAHHGSANQDPQLLREVNAPLGVISVGADNDYGHPAPSLLDLLARSGTTVLRTDRGGDVAVGTDGDRVVARTLR